MFAEVAFHHAGGENPLLLVPALVNDQGPYTSSSIPAPAPRSSRRGSPTAGGRGDGFQGRHRRGRRWRASPRSRSARHAAHPCRSPSPPRWTGSDSQSARIDGDVGSDFLRDYRVSIDYQKEVLRLVQGADDVSAAARAMRSEVAFRLASPVKPLVLVGAFVDGKGPYTFAVDTGASMTTVSPALASRLGIEAAENVSMTGAGGVLQATVGRVASLAVGAVSFENLPVVVSNSSR